MSITEKLLKIQTELKAPKNQFNAFGKYNYRSCEDILEAVKPLLAKNKATMTISDDVVIVGDRIYVKATVKLTDKENGQSIENTAFAREEQEKKGMDGSQITGASSSYARKYALNGLFLIDDTKDSDATNTHGKEEKKTEEKATKVQIEEINKLFDEQSKAAMLGYFKANTVEELSKKDADVAIEKRKATLGGQK